MLVKQKTMFSVFFRPISSIEALYKYSSSNSTSSMMRALRSSHECHYFFVSVSRTSSPHTITTTTPVSPARTHSQASQHFSRVVSQGPTPIPDNRDVTAALSNVLPAEEWANGRASYDMILNREQPRTRPAQVRNWKKYYNSMISI